MCCVFTTMLLFGPRLAILIWWLINPRYFSLVFSSSGGWLGALVGALFLPWTMIMYLIVFPNGVVGLDWLWLGLGFLADIVWYMGGGFRRRFPGYSGSY